MLLAGQIVRAADINRVIDMLGGKDRRSGTHSSMIMSGNAGETGVSVSFGATFVTSPEVRATVQVGGNIDLLINVQGRSTTGFTYRVVTRSGNNVGSNVAYSVHWEAAGELA